MGPGPYSPKFSWEGKYKKMIVSLQPTRQAKGFLQPKSQSSGYRLLAALGSAAHCGCGAAGAGEERTEQRGVRLHQGSAAQRMWTVSGNVCPGAMEQDFGIFSRFY